MRTHQFVLMYHVGYPFTFVQIKHVFVYQLTHSVPLGSTGDGKALEKQVVP